MNSIDNLKQAASIYKQAMMHSAAMSFMLNTVITEIEGANADQRVDTALPEPKLIEAGRNGKRKLGRPKGSYGRSASILAAFQGKETMSTLELYEALSLTKTNKRRACYQTIKRLAKKGLLKPTTIQGTYQLTARGRKAA